MEVMGVEEVKGKLEMEWGLEVMDMVGVMGDRGEKIGGWGGVGEKRGEKVIGELGRMENVLGEREEVKGGMKKKVEEKKEEMRL